MSTTAGYLTRNIQGSAVCWHCGTPGRSLGIVAIDEWHFPNGQPLAAPCPMCEQGQMHALAWSPAEGHARIDFWSQPGWNAGALSWNGGLTRDHRYTCQRFECGVQMTESGLCGDHRPKPAQAPTLRVPSVGTVPRELTPDEQDAAADQQMRRVRSTVMNEAI